MLTVLPLLLFVPLPASEMSLEIDAEAKLVNGPMAAVRGLPSVSISVTGPQHKSTGRFAAQLREAALRQERLGRQPRPTAAAHRFRAIRRLHSPSRSPGTMRLRPASGVTLSHDGEGIPLRQDFITRTGSIARPTFSTKAPSLAAQLFALDGEIYAHAALEGLQSTLMRCMSATAQYRKLLTRESFQEAWKLSAETKAAQGR